jgi:hypothetical protein
MLRTAPLAPVSRTLYRPSIRTCGVSRGSVGQSTSPESQATRRPVLRSSMCRYGVSAIQSARPHRSVDPRPARTARRSSTDRPWRYIPGPSAGMMQTTSWRPPGHSSSIVRRENPPSLAHLSTRLVGACPSFQEWTSLPHLAASDLVPSGSYVLGRATEAGQASARWRSDGQVQGAIRQRPPVIDERRSELEPLGQGLVGGVI